MTVIIPVELFFYFVVLILVTSLFVVLGRQISLFATFLPHT